MSNTKFYFFWLFNTFAKANTECIKINNRNLKEERKIELRNERYESRNENKRNKRK